MMMPFRSKFKVLNFSNVTLSTLKNIFKKMLLYLYLTKYKNKFLYFGSVCIVKSWYKLEEDGLEGLNGVDKA